MRPAKAQETALILRQTRPAQNRPLAEVTQHHDANSSLNRVEGFARSHVGAPTRYPNDTTLAGRDGSGYAIRSAAPARPVKTWWRSWTRMRGSLARPSAR